MRNNACLFARTGFDRAENGRRPSNVFGYLPEKNSSLWARGRGLQSWPSKGQKLVAPVCKHWRRKGSCMFGAECFFLHSDEALRERELELARVRAANGKKQNRGPGKRNRILNDGRASAGL